jgi:hypothetical protein
MTQNNKAQHAINAFLAGDMGEAKRVSAELVNSGQCGVRDTPYAKAEMMDALLDYFCGRKNEAYGRIYHILRLEPDNGHARNLFHFLLQEKMESDRNPGRLVFGLGTGRSGSSTLTRIIQNIPGAYASHEHSPLLKWQDDLATVDWHLQRMRLLSHDFPLVSDVSHWWLPYTDYIVQSFDNARFIAVKRPKAATVASFLRIKGGNQPGAINHWINHDGQHFRKSAWDPCYPKFEAASLEQAISLYWDHYYERCDHFAQKYPDIFLTISLDDLSSGGGIGGICQFLGVPVPSNMATPHLNKDTVQDGEHMIPPPFHQNAGL